MNKHYLLLLLTLLFFYQAEAQQILRGTISDSGGVPLPGAAIKVAGTDKGFITDVNGVYEISGIRFPARIVVSFIGYADTELELTGNEPVPYNIVLDDSKNLLDEVVVVVRLHHHEQRKRQQFGINQHPRLPLGQRRQSPSADRRSGRQPFHVESERHRVGFNTKGRIDLRHLRCQGIGRSGARYNQTRFHRQRPDFLWIPSGMDSANHRHGPDYHGLRPYLHHQLLPTALVPQFQAERIRLHSGKRRIAETF